MPRTRVLSAITAAALVAAVPIAVTASPAGAATKYGITCKTGGLTTVAKPPYPDTRIRFAWYTRDGILLSTEIVSGRSASTPTNAAKVDVRQFLTSEETSYRPMGIIGCR